MLDRLQGLERATVTTFWSVSQSATWKCPLQWWMRYHAQVPPAQPEPSNRVRGRAEHLAMETAYRAAAADPDWRPGTLMSRHRDPAAQALEHHWRTEEPQVVDWDVLRAVEDVTAVLDSLPAPVPRAVGGVEKRFAFDWTVNGFTVGIGGVIDLLLRTTPRSVHVRDWKHNTIGDPADSPQMAVYDQAVRNAPVNWLDGPERPERVTVGLYSIRGNREEVAELPARRREELLHGLIADAAEAADAVADRRDGRPVIDAFPARPDPDRCGGCPFRSYCPETSAGTWPVRPGVDVERVRTVVSARLRKVSSIG